MSQCPICDHAKVDAINTELANNVAHGIIVRRYRLEPVSFGVHVAHIFLERQQAHVLDTRVSLAELLIAVPDDPMRRVKQHINEAARIWWDEVDDDRRSPERLQLILAEAFADPNLGL